MVRLQHIHPEDWQGSIQRASGTLIGFASVHTWSIVYIPLLFWTWNVALVGYYWRSLPPREFLSHPRYRRRLLREGTWRTFAPGETLAECQFDGHRPVNTTSAARPQTSSLGGLCVPYNRGRLVTSEGQATPTSQPHSDCVRDCSEQVVSMGGEGRFYHYHPPGPVATQIVDAVPGRPQGCNVIFHPLHNGATMDWGGRLARRLRRSDVRVDPFFDENKEDDSLKYNAFCNAPCQDNADCGARVGFHCSSGTCV
jgi:hypothetical protein